VVPDERGDPAFEGAQTRGDEAAFSIAAAVPAASAPLCVFDVLLVDGGDLRRLPPSERLRAKAPTEPRFRNATGYVGGRTDVDAPDRTSSARSDCYD